MPSGWPRLKGEPVPQQLTTEHNYTPLRDAVRKPPSQHHIKSRYRRSRTGYAAEARMEPAESRWEETDLKSDTPECNAKAQQTATSALMRLQLMMHTDDALMIHNGSGAPTI